MSIEAVGVLTIGVGSVALVRAPAFGFSFLLGSMLLGAAAAFLVPGLGSIQPPHVLLIFVGIVALRDRPLFERAIGSVRPFTPGFFLLCICCYGLVSGYFMPRLFAGHLEIDALNTPEYSDAFFRIPLRPTNGNITQSVYMICDVVCFALFSAFASGERGRTDLVRAFLWYGAANIGFAAVDLATSVLGISWTLDFIRNASYVVYADSSVGDARRIIGSFTEASAFAFATLGVTCFALRLWLGGIYTKSAFTIGATSFALLLASTSSTAYVALVPPMLVLTLGSLARTVRGRASRQDAAFLLIAPLLTASCVLLICLNSSLRAVVGDYLNNVIFLKSLSASGIERARLNQEAINAFFDTHFLGLGLGSARTSSFVTASLANLGLIGTAIFAVFFSTLAMHGDPTDDGEARVIRAAAKYGCFGLLSAATVSGALTELGLPFYVLAALASAKAVVESARNRRPAGIERPLRRGRSPSLLPET